MTDQPVEGQDFLAMLDAFKASVEGKYGTVEPSATTVTWMHRFQDHFDMLRLDTEHLQGMSPAAARGEEE